MDKEKVWIKLNSVCFAECEKIKIGDMLYDCLEASPRKRYILHRVMHILRSFVCDNNKFVIKGSPKTLFSN